MKRKLKIVALFLILINLVGCVSNNFAYKQIAKCPQYFQDNIGKVEAEVISPMSLIVRGYVDPKEPNCPIHLYGLASNFITWHEAFHSFESRAFINRNDEWELFYYDFGFNRKNYLGCLVVIAQIFFPCIEEVPIPGKVRFYGSLNWVEDTADCFAYWMQIQQGKKQRKDKVLQHKLKAIEKFVTGQYNGDYVESYNVEGE